MILNLQDIARILKERPNKQLIHTVQDYSRKLTMHITGAGIAKYIEKLEYFEKDELYRIRLKYTRSNKDFFARLHRPIEKIFSAAGGSVYYDMPEPYKRDFVSRLQDVEWGHSLRQWIKTFWVPTYHYDPMGLIQMEVDYNGETYPTYKPTSCVYDYQLDGRQPEYVIYELDTKKEEKTQDGKQRKLFRVIDDAVDYLIEWDGAEAKPVAEMTFANHYGKVPAFIISDIYDPQRGYYISPDDNIIELADQYLREGGVLNVFKNHHGFPQKWRYMGACNTCKGTTLYHGDTCPACNGSGVKTKYDVAEDINLPIPDQGQPVLAPPMGNIDVAVDSWQQMDSSIENLFNMAWFTKWGEERSIKTSGLHTDGNKTATESLLNEQPKIDALYTYSRSAEETEKAITDYMGSYYYDAGYKGAQVQYGKRFIIESPDRIMETLLTLIEKSAPYEVIREKQEEYYCTLYQSDSLKLNIALKLMDVEPLPFYPLAQAKSLLPAFEFAKKICYNDWRGLRKTKDSLLTASVEELRAMLEAYTTEQLSKDNIATNTPAAAELTDTNNNMVNDNKN